MTSARPLIAHVVYHFGVGGLENGLVNLINRLPHARYRHVIVSLTGSSEMAERIRRDDVEVICLHKPEGNSPVFLFRLWRLCRRLRPAIVHSRNLAAMEAQLPAWLAGVPGRVHGEHGRDVADLDMRSTRYRRWRQLFRPLIQRYIPLSAELADYLRREVGVGEAKLRPIINGVDTERFHPARGERKALLPPALRDPGLLVIGSVGRLERVKDQLTLARAFVRLCETPTLRQRLRLVLVGEGRLRPEIEAVLSTGGVRDLAWLPGSRDDVPALLQAFDIFVLPSLAEGISNTLLEAMACGLPVVATNVGGNPELVVDGETGLLVPRDDPASMAAAIGRYIANDGLRLQHAAAARRRSEAEFSLATMVVRYQSVYDELLVRQGLRRPEPTTLSRS